MTQEAHVSFMCIVTNSSKKCKLIPHITSHLSEWPSSISQQTTGVEENVEKREPSCTVGRSADWCSHWKTEWRVLRKLKLELPFDPAIPFLGKYLKTPKTLIQKNVCISMFIAVLFVIAKIRKQPKCPK